MAINLVQTVGNTSTASSTTLSMGNTTTGNLMFVAAYSSGAVVANSITDSQSNTYTIVGSQTTTLNTGTITWAYAKNITGGTTPTITVNYNSTVGQTEAAIAREYSGLDINNPLDQFTSATGASTSLSSGSVTNLYQAELIIGIGFDTLGTANTFTAGSGFGNLTTQTNTGGMALEDQIVSSAFTGAATFTISPTSTSWCCAVVTFQAALPVSVVQQFIQTTTSPNTISLPNTPVQGNLILVTVANINVATFPTSVVDGNSNALTQLFAQARPSTSNYTVYGMIATASQSKVFTVTRGTTAGLRETVYEISSVTGWPAIGSIVDGSIPLAGNSGSTNTSATGATYVTTQATDIMLYFLALASAQSNLVLTPASGAAANILKAGGVDALSLAVETSTGTYGATATWSGTAQWVMGGLPLKPKQVVTISQVAANLTASGGTQSIATINDIAISQLAANLTATGRTQTIVAINIVAISQSTANLTTIGGTQVVTISGGSTSASITQVKAVLTASDGGGTAVATVNVAAISQLAANLTASTGTQSVATINVISISQSVANLTVTGGTQSITTVNNVSITQTAASLTASGSVQVIATIQDVNIAQIGGGSGLSASRVQYKHSYPGSTATFTSNVTIGDIIVVATSNSGNTTPTPTLSVSDNLGNTYNQIEFVTYVSSGTGTITAGGLFYAVITTGGSCTVTTTWAHAAISDPGLTIVEYSGLGTSPTVTGYVIDDGSNPLQASVSAIAGDLIFAMWADEASNVYSSPTSGFSLIQHDSSHYDAQIEYLNVPSTTNYNAGFNLTSGSAYSLVIAADFSSGLSGTPIITATGGVQSVSTGSVVNASISQLAATLTITGGIQVIATINIVAINQLASKLTIGKGNLVANADFEYAPPFTAPTTSQWIDGNAGGSASNDIYGWGFTSGGSSGSHQAFYDNSTSYSGSYSMKVSLTSTGSNTDVSNSLSVTPTNLAKYAIPVTPSTTYYYSFWMRTNNVSGSSSDGAYINFNERNSSGTSTATNTTTKVQTTTGWTQYSGSFTTTSTSVFLLVRLSVTGNSGAATLIMDAWYDDIVLDVTSANTIITTVNDVSISQVGAAITATTGLQAISTLNIVAISQSNATLTASGGSQGIQDIQDVQVVQLEATLVTTGGTQTVNTVNTVSLSQVASVLTTTGGVQSVIASGGNIAITQMGASLTTTPGTQVISTSTGPLPPTAKSKSIIFLTSGQLATRLSSDIYMPL